MSKTVVIRFVPPAPIKVKTGKNASRLREWNTDKLGTFLQAGLTNAMPPALSDADVRVVVARRPDIQFEGWTPEQGEVETLQEMIGEAMGEIMADIDPEDYLQA